uniref:Uncharacterized protein n=1 Tax=Anopheles atroparvus TaxID=41427 RepID=A0A182IMX5_ANOAO
MFATPRGYNLVAEMDMYHPLPDYMYHATSLRLGTVAMYPSETSTPPKPTASPSSDHEPSEQDVKQYLAKHPDTWIPPSWSMDRSDWRPISSASNASQRQNATAARPVPYQWWKSRLWETTGNDRLYYHNPSVRRVRSLAEGHAETDEEELSFWAEDNHLNISHHRGWEHFHHYRDRRSLYDHLETTIPSFFGFHMKECLLRSICEARNLLPPKGRSMTVDILRVIFTRLPWEGKFKPDPAENAKANGTEPRTGRIDGK